MIQRLPLPEETFEPIQMPRLGRENLPNEDDLPKINSCYIWAELGLNLCLPVPRQVYESL